MTPALRTAQSPVVDLRIVREDPKTTVYRVVVFDGAPLAACVVTCSREPDGVVWHGSCVQWQAHGTCSHIDMAQTWDRQGRQPQQAPDSLLTQLQHLRQQVKQDGPPKHPKPTPRRWRPTIEHVVPGPALQALDQTPHQAQGEDVKTPILQARPRRQQQAQERWRQFNEQTATKYKVETPGHHCPVGWHTGDDGKCHPADATHQQQAQQDHVAHPDNVTKHHDHLLAQLSGGEISASKRLDPNKSGVNQTHIITLKGDGQGIYKPAAGAGLEMGAENERLLSQLPPSERFAYDHLLRNQHRREALFYDLERRFAGTHLTPPTTLRHDSSGGEGSIQHMVTGARTFHEVSKDQWQQLAEADPCIEGSLQDLLAVDLFQGSADRRTPNVLLQHDPKQDCYRAVAIDNGISGQLPTLGGGSQSMHVSLALGVNQLRPEHVTAMQQVVDGGMAPLIHRAVAHGLHPNEGRQRYLNALFVTRKVKTEPIKNHDDLADKYVDFLLEASQDKSLPHDVRETVHAAIEQKLVPYDEDERAKGIAKFTPKAKAETAPTKETGPAAHAPTQLKSLQTLAAAPIAVAVMKLGEDKPLATFTLSGTRLTVDNELFYADLRRLPYHFGGAAKLLALVQQYATASYLHLRFVHGSLDELVAQVPKDEVQLPPPVLAQREFAAKLQARRAAKRN